MITAMIYNDGVCSHVDVYMETDSMAEMMICAPKSPTFGKSTDIEHTDVCKTENISLATHFKQIRVRIIQLKHFKDVDTRVGS